MTESIGPRTYRGDIWDLHAQGAWLVDPTNLSLKHDGSNVMGRGLSAQVARRYPEVPAQYGAWLLAHLRPDAPAGVEVSASQVTPGPLLRAMRARRLLMAPVKYEWRHRASLALIERSLAGLAAFLAAEPAAEVALPRLGCGAGGRDWEREVHPLVTTFLDGLSDEAAARVILVEASDTT